MKKFALIIGIFAMQSSLTSCSTITQTVVNSIFDSDHDDQKRRAEQYEKDDKPKKQARRLAYFDSVGYPTGG